MSCEDTLPLALPHDTSITLNLAYTPSVSNGSEIARDIVSEAGWEDGGGTDGWRDGGMEGGV